MQNNIGDARRLYAEKYGKFTQDDAADFFGVAPSTYKGWEQGVGNLNGKILCAIADKYECSVEFLLRRTESPSFERVRVLSAPTYNEREAELLELFHSCNQHGCEQIMVFARGCAASFPKNQANNLGA